MFKSTKAIILTLKFIKTCNYSVVKIEFLSKFFEFLSNNLSTSPTYLHLR